ncbi:MULTISPECIES: DMT family transporter [Roseivirga]|jgi:drug/metabolite transporter (DMT)-like permease|uniref:Permease n=1 Tax=Roseivirga thermotolerans TaxID=1758176 RepID=A0ABQ3I7L8_9BACT|nr:MULTISPECIES: DMT family transporter [Roseivirga]MEC7756077.1 DMT family transporter [Bacteroidota bacterium]GHE62090.1 permease [Roseivirga thermotolerans]|tara:strand:- start:12337 stop:13266 length:930 start_codon:yes stop_codon:yes gene_type:complete
MESASLRDFLKLHFIVFLWGFTAILGNEMSIDSTDLVLYRTGIAALVLSVVMRFKDKTFKFPPRGVFHLFLTGLVVAAHWVTFFEAARVSTVSVCLAGMATTTFWTSLVEPLFKKQRIQPFQVFLGLVVIFGLYLIFKFEFTHAYGLLLAIISAFLAAVFSVLNSKFTLKYPPYGITFYEMLSAAVGLLLFIPVYKTFVLHSEIMYQWPEPRDWVLLLLLSGVCTVYAFSVGVELMKRISAFVVNLTINLEPVYGIVLALLIYGEDEQMSTGFYYGTLVILGAVLTYPVIRRMQRRRQLSVESKPKMGA